MLNIKCSKEEFIELNKDYKNLIGLIFGGVLLKVSIEEDCIYIYKNLRIHKKEIGEENNISIPENNLELNQLKEEYLFLYNWLTFNDLVFYKEIKKSLFKKVKKLTKLI